MKHFFPRWSLAALLPALLILTLSAASVAQEPATPQKVQTRARNLQPQTLLQMGALEQEEDQRTPAQQKLDSHLWYAAKMKAGMPVAAGVAALHTGVTEDALGLVLVDMDADVSDVLLTQISAAGGKIVNNFPQYHAIRARLPLFQLERLAELPAVHFIKPADLPILQRRSAVMPLRPLIPGLTARLRQASAPPPTGSVDSEGDTTHRANLARSTFHVDGTGIKIGVISDSDDFLENSQASGNLPSNVTVLSGQSGRPGSGEGTAMMEIVHDIAPGASIYFATAGGSQSAFANNIMGLYNAGCKIIVDDISFSGESPFQDGVPAQAVEYVTAHGAIYFSSAGNYGNKADGTAGVWASDFVDSGQTITATGGGKVAVFIANDGVTGQPSLINNVSDSSGNGQNAVLFWSDPLGHSTNDYNLFVVDGSGKVVDASTNVQNGSQDPSESVTGVPDGDALVIVLHSGVARYLHLDLASQNGTLNWITGQRTRGHATVNAVGAYGVAATPADTASPNYGQPTGPYPSAFSDTNLVEFFSSDGPSHQFYHEDGTLITPGNVSSTGGVILQKPDITAADGVTTSLSAAVTGGESFAPFFGTSAAAPHAAAITALLLSYNPSLTQAQVRSLLTGTAIDIMGTGWDQDSGYGILDADALLAAAPTATPAPTLTSFAPTSGPVGTSVILTGTNFTGATAVKFNGTAATFTVNSAMQITATVPTGATTGTISVTTSGGTAVSAASFTVTMTTKVGTTLSLVNPTGAPGQTVSLTARLKQTVSGTELSGETLTFSVDSKSVGTAVTGSTGLATLSYVIPSGEATGTHPLTASFAGDSANNAGSVTGTLTVTGGSAPALSSLAYNPNPGFSSGMAVGTATLSGPAPAGGASVVISYNGTTLATLVIAAGQTSGTYQQGLPAVTAGQSFVIGAAYSGKTVNTTLVVNPTTVALSGFTLSPNPATSGGTLNGTLTLSAAAPAGGATITISQNAAVLGHVTVAAGSTSQSFSVFAPAVSASTVFTYAAAYNGASKTVQETVNPASGLP